MSAIAVMSVEVKQARTPYRRILVPTDGSELSNEAVAQALNLASATGAAIVFLTVNEPFHVFTTSIEMIESTRAKYERETEAHADRILEQAGAWADEASIPYFSTRVWAEHPHEEIIKTARERDCDLIAMASHGRRGLSAVVLGSVTQKVLAHSDIPVLVLRKPAGAPSQNALRKAATDHIQIGVD